MLNHENVFFKNISVVIELQCQPQTHKGCNIVNYFKHSTMQPTETIVLILKKQLCPITAIIESPRGTN